METNMIQTNIVQNLSNNLNFHLLIIWSFWQVEEMVTRAYVIRVRALQMIIDSLLQLKG